MGNTFEHRAPVSDLELLRRSVAEPEAFGVFYGRHAQAVLRYCHLRTGSPETAADLTAEVFAAAFTGRARFRDQGRPARNWLFGIASRQIGLYARRRRVSLKHRRRLGVDRMELDDGQLDQLEARLDSRALRAALGRASGSHCAWMRLGLDVGLDTLAATAARLGLRQPPEPYPSLPLGGVEVSPLELAVVNATLAAGGIRREPYLIDEVSQSGRFLYRTAVGPGTAAVERATACRVTQTLRLAADRGEQPSDPGEQPTAAIGGGSTLTGQMYHAGHTADLATVVWVEDLGEPVAASGTPTAADTLAPAFWNEFNQGWSKLDNDAPTSFPDCDAASRPPERIATAWD